MYSENICTTDNCGYLNIYSLYKWHRGNKLYFLRDILKYVEHQKGFFYWEITIRFLAFLLLTNRLHVGI